MRATYRLLILGVSCLVLWKSFQYFLSSETPIEEIKQEAQQITDKVKVTVYYEALCTDSRYFILKQLVPTYEALPGSIKLDLVPYGKAKTMEHNGKITFECQHAAMECLANKIHSCSIRYISDPYLLLKYIACMINDNMIPRTAAETCGKSLDVDFDPIIKCAESDEGSVLLKRYGQRTHALDPPVRFIPTMELNGNQDVQQSKLLKNLLKEVCNLLHTKPTACPT